MLTLSNDLLAVLEKHDPEIAQGVWLYNYLSGYQIDPKLRGSLGQTKGSFKDSKSVSHRAY